MYDFKDTINGYKSWANLFQSMDAFKHLIHRIFKKEKLQIPNAIDNLTPGTNAVFKVDDKVIKIFAPEESTFRSKVDYENEIQSLQIAKDHQINCPSIIKHGFIKDKYLFYYIIMDFIKGIEFKDAYPTYSKEELINFSKKLRLITNKLNNVFVNKPYKPNPLDWRWDNINPNVRKQAESYLETINEEQVVFVHGDITKENVLIDEDGDIFIIDFADSLYAPRYYEYPPIVFDLFDFNKTLILAFFDNKEKLVDELFISLLIHDFGGDFVKIVYERLTNKKISELEDLFELKDILKKYLLEDE